MTHANQVPPEDDAELGAFTADPELAEMFIADATDHLGTIEATILKLEAAPTDLKLVNDIFRPFHTVKGNAGILGITSIQEFAHKVETLLDLARSGKHPMGPPEIDVVLKTVDLLKLIIDELPARAAGKPTTDVSARRRELMDRVDALIAGSTPPRSQVAAPDAAASGQAQSSGDDAGAGKVNRAEDQSTVKVDTKKLDNLVDMVGELVIAQAILAEDPALRSGRRAPQPASGSRQADHKRSAARHDGDAHGADPPDVSEDVASRARPLAQVRQTLQPAARGRGDRARSESRGAPHRSAHAHDAERDRSRRRASERRLAAGKPATAELKLSAFHRAGFIVVELADDGAGLDTDQILAKGVKLGLIPEGARPDPSEIHQLIFQPGFSTAAKVTELSGRGVGMDVVRRNIEALRGRIDIQTVRGKGTTFSIQLPLTLAIVDGILLGVGADRFVIPTFAVLESFRPLPEQVQTLQGQACMVQVRDRLYPLLHLGEVFGIAGARQRISEGTVIICHDSGRSIALAVDELIGKQEVVIKGLGEMFREVRGIAGGAILGDGRIGLILDTGGLLSLVGKTASQVAA